MLKKVLACLAALLLINTFLFAQVSDEAEVVSEGVSEAPVRVLSEKAQTQHIQWGAVKRAYGYAVELQQKDGNIWMDYDSWEIEEPEFDFFLDPGFYRFRISVLNTLGRKSGTSEWAEFEIVDETQPVLHRQTFPDSERYNIPVLTRSISDENGTEIITVRGINCFTADTSFSLIPSTDGSEPFKVLDAQQKVQLPVADTDPASHTVRLSVDWSRLVPGYYTLCVEKLTGGTDSFEILVQPERVPDFTVTDLVFDDIIRAQCLDLTDKDGRLTLETDSIQSDTEFTFMPVSNPDNPYPFVSGITRQTVPVKWLDYKNGKLDVQIDASEVKPGWYEFSAATPDAEPYQVLVLIQADDSLSTLPEIEDVSCKLDKKSQTFAFTIKTGTAFFSEEQAERTKVYAISEKDDVGNNKRIQLRMTSTASNEKSAVYEASVSAMEPGFYAIMIETEESMRLGFIELSDKFKADLVSLSDNEIKRRFLLAPDEATLAARAERKAKAEESGLKLPEYIPAFREEADNSWIYSMWGSFPATVTNEDDALVLNTQNLKPNTPYSKDFRLIGSDSLSMLQESEGISFESMVTGRNNGKTKWEMNVTTLDGTVTIPLNSDLKKLSQTVVIWGDYSIDPYEIEDVTFRVEAKQPHEAGWDNTLEIYEAKTYSSLDPVKRLTFKDPLLFTRIGAYAGLNISEDPGTFSSNQIPVDFMYDVDDRLGDSGVPSYMYLSVFDTGWFSVNAVYAPAGMGSRPMFGIENTLAIPNDWFKPYVGTSFLYNGDMLWQATSFGVVLFKYLDLRYMAIDKKTTLNALNFVTADPSLQNTEVTWSSDWFQLGLQLPLRKQKMQYTEPTVLAAKDPVLFTELHFGIRGENVDETHRPYLYYLDDYFAGVRLVGFKYFAVDADVGFHDMPINNMKNYGSLMFGGDMKFQLPLFKGNFTPFVGLGAGYNYGNFYPDNYVYMTSEVGVRLGKYLTVSYAGKLAQDDMDEFLDLAKSAPPLAPATFIMSSDYAFKVTVSIPLRTKK